MSVGIVFPTHTYLTVITLHHHAFCMFKETKKMKLLIADANVLPFFCPFTSFCLGLDIHVILLGNKETRVDSRDVFGRVGRVTVNATFFFPPNGFVAT